MGEHERDLIQQAMGKHRKIFPCSGKKNIEDCFTRHGNTVILWYNTEDRSTHVVKKEIG